MTPDEIPKYPVWWTNCPDPDCDIGVTITANGPDLIDPDEAAESMDCPYCGSSLTGWNGDPR